MIGRKLTNYYYKYYQSVKNKTGVSKVFVANVTSSFFYCYAPGLIVLIDAKNTSHARLRNSDYGRFIAVLRFRAD